MQRVLALVLASTPAAAFAQAADAAAPASASPLMNLLPLVLIIGVFYVMLIKPQQRRLKEHAATLGALKKGDEVVTGGGIVGKITKLGDADTLTVEIAKGVEVTVLKSTVTGLLTAPKPVVVEKKKTDKNDNTVVSRNSVANDN